ncbi:hypothetical protein [Deinococcus budaensis]|uniref:Uncharacterized protein n=1 Tax=Deinococcus budaensis TaxID=1665626 RepID=A0A7W8GI54_9DEIO|nr:hypothetical protein [Deinococcus budaensis]MBB5235718.1 hypothetical protein [Deinococcus budaensis]
MTDPKSPQTADPASYMGATPEAPDTNTNLDAAVPGGPATPADRQATDTIEEQHADGGLPGAVEGQSDPARQMDNSGMLRPTGEGDGAAIIGASGDDRNDGDR